jgi:energy-converting hydrogenase Eha subunit A
VAFNKQPGLFDSHGVKTKYFDIVVMFYIFCNAFIKIPNTALNIGFLLFVLLLLWIKNYRAVLIGFCICGIPFMSLLKKYIGFSITQAIIGTIAIQLAVLLISRKHSILTGLKKGCVPRYLFIILSICTLFLVSFLVAQKTEYNLYYIQFFIVYVVFYSLGGVLVVQKSITLKTVLLPAILFISCLYPLFQFTLFNVPAKIYNSPVGLRGVDAMDSISVGRFAGGLIILALCVLWETRTEKKPNLFVFSQITLALVISGPLLWYSQTRQAMLSVIVSIIIGAFIILITNKKMSLWQRSIVFLTPVLLIWISLIFLNWAEAHLAQVRVKEFNDISRERLWAQAWEGIKIEPIIGHGLGSYYAEYFSWPHNWFLEAWHDYGVLGLMLFIILVIALFARAYTSQNTKSLWVFVGIYWVIVAQVSADIPRNSALFFFFTIALLPFSEKISSNKKFKNNAVHSL